MKRSPISLLAMMLAVLCGTIGIGLALVGIPYLQTVLDRLSNTGGLDVNYLYMLEAAEIIPVWLIGVVILATGVALVPRAGWQKIGERFRALSLSQVLLTVLVLSFGINLLLIAFIPYQLWEDYEIYHTLTVDLLAGRGVQRGWLESSGPSAFWAIGYPAFLAPFYAIFGQTYQVGQVINALLRLATIVCTGLLTRRLFGVQVAKGAILLLGFFPSLLFHTLTLGYNLLLITLYSLIAYLAIGWERPQWGRTILLGVLVGSMIYVRATYLFLPALLLLLWVTERRHTWQSVLAHTVTLGAIAALCIAPWLWRSYQLFGQWVPMYTNGGVNLYIGNNTEATGGYYSTPAFAHSESVVGMNEAEQDGYFRALAVAWIAQNPQQVAINAVKKVAQIFMRDDQAVSFATKIRYAELPAPLLLSFVLLANLYYGIIAAVAVGYAIWAWFRRRWTRVLSQIALLVGYVVVLYLPFFGMDHYKTPFLFVLTIFAALALRDLVRASRLSSTPTIP